MSERERERERERQLHEKVNRKRGGDERKSNRDKQLMNRIQFQSMQLSERKMTLVRLLLLMMMMMMIMSASTPFISMKLITTFIRSEEIYIVGERNIYIYIYIYIYYISVRKQ